MKKVLFVATVVKKHINAFHIPYLKLFKEMGYETHVCARNDFENKEDLEIPFCDKYYDLPFERSPYKVGNIKVYKQLKKIIDSNNYEIIHCHTPMGSVITRLAARESRKKGTSVLYTAHGFHFYKGAPIKNWLIYYPVEKWLSKHTDCLITINNEDFEIAKKNFKTKQIELVNGVGIDTHRFTPQSLEKKLKLREEYGYSEKDFLLISVAELNYNKQQDLLINVVYLLKNKIPNLKLLLVGDGELKEHYSLQVSELGLGENVEFLGYRKDVANLLALSDIAVSSSRREGLPLNVMEAMATGLPLVVTNCRGNRDLVADGKNGYVVDINDVETFGKRIEELYLSPNKRETFGQTSLKMIEDYKLINIKNKMKMIYSIYGKN